MWQGKLTGESANIMHLGFQKAFVKVPYKRPVHSFEAKILEGVCYGGLKTGCCVKNTVGNNEI